MWASFGGGEANEIRIGTWAKVEMEKLSKLSVSGVKDNFPGLLLDLKKKEREGDTPRGIQSSDSHLQARGLWNYKVTRTTIKPQYQAQTKTRRLKDFSSWWQAVILQEAIQSWKLVS